jgi:hypothetical protein
MKHDKFVLLVPKHGSLSGAAVAELAWIQNLNLETGPL